jgi:alginate O-acetyltransferase complex protein AlgI
VLFTFKYFNFFNGAVGGAANALGIQYPIGALSLALPVGISFYTFQSMAYSIDVYRGHVTAEKHAGIFAAFIAFFPQMVAGPIERANHMLPQFRRTVRFDADRTVEGLRRILWGVFKKIVISDRLAIYVNAVYNDAQAHSGAPLIIATVFFAFQIYCDFSAYTDIAIGTAKIIGFDLSENFRQPYFSRSVGEFWRRWHITLSNWFRDYLYIPLGGSRARFSRHLLNLMIVFLVSGLWHGAAWTFVIWGGLHGIFVCVEAAFSKAKIRVFPRNAVGGMLRLALTFTAICVAWVFFRANSLDDAVYIFTHAFSASADSITAPFEAGLLPNFNEMVLSISLIAVLLVIDYGDSRFNMQHVFARSPALVRWGTYYGMTAAIIFSGWYGSGAQQFIYFQF